MRFSFLIMPVVIMLTCGSVRADDAGTQAKKAETRLELVQQMTTVTLSILQDQKKSLADREEAMKRGIINMVDIDRIARSALGVAWKRATEEQRVAYTNVYRRYLTKLYISNFAQNAERKISDMRALGVDAVADEEFTARTELRLSTGETLRVNYLVSERGGSNQIIDINIEGVSLLVTHRAEFSQIAMARGVDGVIQALERAINADMPKVQLSSM